MPESTLQITVDKSHLVTIGEQLYSRSVELLRELVNNTYDADATEVYVEISPDRVVVSDDGTGMDREGLGQYFVIGSSEKRLRHLSKKFRRERVGQFGIGKFASLSAAGAFEVYTQSGGFAARVTFDKKEWEKTTTNWGLPLEICEYDPARGDGTTITLSDLVKPMDLDEAEQRLMESVPLKAQHFKVFLNGKRLTPRQVQGKRLPFLEGTPFGPVHGEIIILPASRANTEDLGIGCYVKQVLVKKEYFGMEVWGRDLALVRGDVNADFLPITSDRSNFITDTPEYKAFDTVMRKVVEDVRKALGRLTEHKETKVVKRALKDALDRILKALRKNPEYSPFGMLPVGDGTEGAGGAAAEGAKGREGDAAAAGEAKKTRKKREKKPKEPTVKRLTPRAVVQKLKLGHSGVTCCLDHFGESGPECFTEGSVIYINVEHPMYKREARKLDSHTMHVARLISQEISLMKDPKNPRQAFERQSRLLKDAFIEGAEKADTEDKGDKEEGAV
ncbi:MAG: ATP-binding protein [Nitrospirae bacterium]|nr:ATP-binding protein [Nitrospirota bacterium]MBI5695117.1 ATP-binding protein [Nitrospirota bacterium]